MVEWVNKGILIANSGTTKITSYKLSEKTQIWKFQIFDLLIKLEKCYHLYYSDPVTIIFKVGQKV